MEAVYTVAETITRHLFSVSWQVSILIGIIWIIDRLSVRASSLFRYWLWCTVLVRLCIPVSIELPTGIAPSFEAADYMKVPSPRTLPVLRTLTDTVEPPSVLPMYNETAGSIERPVQATHAQYIDPYRLLFFGWLATVTVIALALLAYMLLIRRRLKRCKPVGNPALIALVERLAGTMELSQSVRLLYLDPSIGDVPAATGIMRPCIFLPPRLVDNWSPEELEPILLHELAHIRRRDLPVNWLQIIVQTAFFFHPLVWYANRRIRLLREEVCDDMAVSLTGDNRRRYTLGMLRVVEQALHEPSLGFMGIGLTERKSTLRARITRILSASHRLTTRLTALSVVLLLVIGIAGISVACRKPADDKSESGEKLQTKSVYINPAKMKEISRDDSIVIAVGVGCGEELRPPDEMERSLIIMLEAVHRYAGIGAKIDAHVSLDSEKLLEIPVLFISADSTFRLTKTERKNLENYLRNGGFAFVDNATPQYEYGVAEASLRQMLRDALVKDAKFLPIPNEYPVFHMFFDFNNGPPAGAEVGTEEERSGLQTTSKKINYLEGIWLDNRLVAVYSDKGYALKWKDHINNEEQLKMGVNLVVFALQQEGGIYKKKYGDIPLGLQINKTGYQDYDEALNILTHVKDTSRLPEAARLFSEFIGQFPNSLYTENARYYLGFCYYNNRQFEDAYKAFNLFMSIYPNSKFIPEALFYSGDSNYNVGNLKEAIKRIDRVISQYPQHDLSEKALYMKSWILLDLGQKSEGIETLEMFVKKYPNSELIEKAKEELQKFKSNSEGSSQENQYKNYQQKPRKAPPIIQIKNLIKIGSETIYLHGKELVRDSDYTIDYKTSKILLLNQGTDLTDLKIQYEENNDLEEILR